MTPDTLTELERLAEGLRERVSNSDVTRLDPNYKTPDDVLFTNSAAAIDQLIAEVRRLRQTLSAASGYLKNAAIDLETGAPKTTALATIRGGIELIRKDTSHD
jgi:hypothetical protein